MCVTVAGIQSQKTFLMHLSEIKRDVSVDELKVKGKIFNSKLFKNLV